MEDTLFLSGSGLNISDEVDVQVEQYYNTSNTDEIAVRYFNSACMLLFFLIGLPWNAMVIGIILKRKLYTQPSLMLMLNLAIANLVVLLFHTPLSMVIAIDRQFAVFEDFAPVCKAGAFIILFTLAPITTIALMSVDRVIYLKKPLTYHLIVTPWRMFVAIAVMWIWCIALALPILFAKTSHRLSLDTCTPLLLKTWVAKLMIAEIAVAGLVQFVGCGCIIYITRTHLRKKLHRVLSNSIVRNDIDEAHTQTKRRSAVLKDYSKAQLRLVFVFGAIFVTGLVSLVPPVVICVVSAITDLPNDLYATIYILYLSRSAIYPILEVSLTHKIRTALCELCTAGVIRRQSCCCSEKSVVSAEDV